MDDFERRLAARLDAYEHSVPDAPSGVPSGPPRRHVRWAAVAGALVLAVSVGLVGSRLLTDVRPVGATATPTPSPPAIGWEEIARTGSPLLLANDTPMDVTPFDGGFVMAGNAGNGSEAVWWSSADGSTWNRHDRDPAFADSLLTEVVPTPGGLLIVGTSNKLDADCAGGVFGCNPVTPLRLWSSADGESWQRADVDLQGRVTFRKVLAGRVGLVAIGDIGPAQGETTTMIWTSTDGRQWTPVPGSSGAFAGTIVDEAAVFTGGYLAVGRESGTEGPGAVGAAWFSDDGVTWTRSTSSTPMPELSRVYPTPGGAIAAGGGTIWTTESGTTWQPVRPSDLPFEVTDTGPVFVSDGSLTLVLGHDSAGRDGAWLSRDDHAWIPIIQSGERPTVGQPGVIGTVGTEGVVLVTTVAVADAPFSSTLWFGGWSSGAPVTPVATPSSFKPNSPPPSPTQSEAPFDGWTATPIGDIGSVESVVESGPTLTAIGYGEHGIAVWNSTDGATWKVGQDMQPDDLRTSGITVSTLLWTGSTYVAAGFGGIDGTIPVIVTSLDRVHWQHATIPDPRQCGRINAVLHQGEQLVALGNSCVESPAHGLIWTSDDGLTWTRADTGVANLDGAELRDGVATDDGYIAVGSTSEDGKASSGGIWLSSAGKGEAVALVKDAIFWGVAERDGLYVAVGQRGDGAAAVPAIWTSADGVNWTDAHACGGCTGSISTIAANANGFYAFGTSRADATVFESADGLKWEQDSIAGLGHGEILGIIPSRFGLIAFGYAKSEDEVTSPVVVTRAY